MNSIIQAFLHNHFPAHIGIKHNFRSFSNGLTDFNTETLGHLIRMADFAFINGYSNGESCGHCLTCQCRHMIFLGQPETAYTRVIFSYSCRMGNDCPRTQAHCPRHRHACGVRASNENVPFFNPFVKIGHRIR